MARALLAVLILVVAPAAAAAAVGGSDAAGAALLGVVGTLLVSMQAGRSRVLWWLPLAIVVALVGALLVDGPGWALLLAGLGLVAGAASSRQLLAPFAVTGLLASSAAAFGGGGQLALRLAVFAGASLWAYAVLGRVGLPDVVPRYPVPMPLALLTGALLAVAAGATAAVALRWDTPSAYYLPMFVFLLSMPSPGVRVSENARRRVYGTVAALALALPLSLLEVPGWLRLLVAVVALAASVAWSAVLWLSTALSSFAVILLLDPAGRGLEAGEVRVVAVVVAAALVVLGLVIVLLVGRRADLLPTLDPVDDSDAVEAPA